MPLLPIDPELRPPYRRRTLLRGGQEAGWWDYESENPPGHVVGDQTYDETSYTLRLPAGRRVTLSLAQVDQLLEQTSDEAVRAAVARFAAAK